uniref:Transthyretin n=1 Tax=Myripristis murdjan TaxID=586833 RepID=A0A667XAT2_9TELE
MIKKNAYWDIKHSTIYNCVCLLQEKHGDSDNKCPLMVKILDAVKGSPAGSVSLKVSRQGANGEWVQVATGVTDATGEVHNLITEQEFSAGVYRVEFDTKTYWKTEGSTPFHEVADVIHSVFCQHSAIKVIIDTPLIWQCVKVLVVFEAHVGGHQHYTLALLLSPYSYTTTAVVTNGQP